MKPSPTASSSVATESFLASPAVTTGVSLPAHPQSHTASLSPSSSTVNALQCYRELIDVSESETPSEALLLLAQAMQQSGTLAKHYGWTQALSVNTGYLVLSPAQVRRVSKLVQEAGFLLHTFYTHVPQTQQAAKAQGFRVEELSKQRLQALSHPASASASALVESLLQAAEQPTTATLDEPAVATHATQETTLENTVTEVAMSIEEETPPSTLATSHPAAVLPPPTHQLPTEQVTWIHGTQRSGRVIEAQGHLVVLGDVNRGAELRATGDIVVWGELKGIAHAGFPDQREASIRALKLDALQLRIADIMARRPDQLNAAKASKGFLGGFKEEHSTYLPEVAAVEASEIVISTYGNKKN
ncbi:MAG: septum site-determining protein MinC [Vampirovibrionales bacterium]